MLKIFYNFLKKIKNFIVFIRFAAPWRPDTFYFSRIFYKISSIINIKEYNLRKKKSKNKELINIIDKEKGISKFKLESFNKYSQYSSLINELKNDFFKVDWDEVAKIHSKKFLLTKKIDCEDERLKKLVSLIYPSVSDYLGTLPVLQDAAYWYSPNTFNDNMRSQNWHIDGEDYKQVKVWLPIENVENDSGPLNVINIIETKKIFKKLNRNKIFKKRNNKYTDDEINKFLDQKNVNVITMDTNEISFVDTCNCYHFGSRKDKKPRKLLHLHFTSAFSENIPLFGRKKELKGFDDLSLINQYYKNNYEYIKDNTKLKRFEFKIL